VSAVARQSSPTESYSSLGLDTPVTRTQSWPVAGVGSDILSYVIPGGNADGGDPYTGLDRFGRLVEQRWVTSQTRTVTDDFLYSYDRDGNVLMGTNVVNANFSEQYSYDNLNRLSSFTRGSQTQS
jgi:hypothetical protein